MYKTHGSFLSVYLSFLAQVTSRRWETRPYNLTKYSTFIKVVWQSYRCSWGNICNCFHSVVSISLKSECPLNIFYFVMAQKESCHVNLKPIYYINNAIVYLTTILCVYSVVNMIPLNLPVIIYYSGTYSFIKSWINLRGEECLIKNTIMWSSSGNKFD